MSGNNQDYDNQNDDSQNYDDENQDQEYDSQDDNSQNNGDNCNDDDDGNDQDDNDNDDGNGDDDEDDENAPKYVRLRGLPWSATHKEILDFLKNVNVVGGAEGIHIITRRWDGKNTGEAFVEVKSQQDVQEAMKLDNATMGHRYIEVFNSNPKEAKEILRKTNSHKNAYVVKLRGLPYSVTEQQVEEFFNGLEIKPDREGIVFVMDRRGRATGEAFVQFESQEDTEQALGRNRQKIGHRYIEIFRSSLGELKRSNTGNGRMAPYDLKDRGSNRGGNNSSDYGGNNRGRWGNNNGGFGVGANNTLGFNNLPNFGNNGNFGNNSGNFGNFGNSGGGNSGGGMGNFGNFGNNSGGGNFGNFGNSGNFGNNSGGGNNSGFNRFSGNSGNFGNDFGDFGNFGNNRGNNNSNGGSGSGFNNFGNFGNNMGGGGGGSGFGNNMGVGSGGGNFGPIGGGRNDDYYTVMMRGLPFSSFENDVFKFFEPLRPANVRIHYNKQNGRHNGTAEAMFETYDEAQLAMERHRSQMGSRYIELFFNGKKQPKGGNNYSTGGSMGGGSGGGNSIGVGGGMSGGNAFSRRI